MLALRVTWEFSFPGCPGMPGMPEILYRWSSNLNDLPRFTAVRFLVISRLFVFAFIPGCVILGLLRMPEILHGRNQTRISRYRVSPKRSLYCHSCVFDWDFRSICRSGETRDSRDAGDTRDSAETERRPWRVGPRGGLFLALSFSGMSELMFWFRIFSFSALGGRRNFLEPKVNISISRSPPSWHLHHSLVPLPTCFNEFCLRCGLYYVHTGQSERPSIRIFIRFGSSQTYFHWCPSVRLPCSWSCLVYRVLPSLIAVLGVTSCTELLVAYFFD